MDDEEQVVPASEEQEEELDLDLTEDEGQETEEESVEEIKARLAKAEELAENYKKRAEKAENKPKTTAPAAAPSKKAELDYLDVYALQSANVPVEDVPQVVDYAKYKKISIADALKDNVVKTMLSDAQETRKTASVANTGATRRGTTTKTPEAIYEKAATSGELPETDADFDALVAGRISSGAFSKRR